MLRKSKTNNVKTQHNSANSVEANLMYAIDNGDAAIEQKTIGKRKGLRTVVTIGDKSYQYNPNKITKVLTSKLNKLTKTNQFEATHEIKRVYQDVRLKKALKSYAVKHKAEITDVESNFNLYANAFTITNIHLKALRGLSYLKYQYDKLSEHLSTNPGTKI